MKLTIVGAGKSGMAAVKLAVRLGFKDFFLIKNAILWYHQTEPLHSQTTRKAEYK